VQQIVYGGLTSGVFSVLQSFGALAVVSPPMVIGIGVTLGVVGGGFIGYWLWKRYSAKRRIERGASYFFIIDIYEDVLIISYKD
jgi:hypothetical protein